MGKELVQRWIKKADCDGKTTHCFEETCEILALEWKKLPQRCPTLFFVCGQNHLTHECDTIAFEEHVLCPAKSDALSAISNCRLSLVWRIGIGANSKLTMLVSPLHDLVILLISIAVLRLELTVEHLVNLGWSGGHCTSEDFTSCAIDGYIVAALKCLFTDFECFFVVVDDNFSSATNTDLVHLTSDACGVRRNTTTGCQDTFSCDHST